MKKQSSIQPVTKKDLSVLKKDVSSFRSDFKSTKKSLFGQMLKLEEKVEQTEDKLSKQMKEQHDEVMTTLSNFGGRVTTLEDENTIGTDHTRELRVEVNNHEKRIANLESATTT